MSSPTYSPLQRETIQEGFLPPPPRRQSHPPSQSTLATLDSNMNVVADPEMDYEMDSTSPPYPSSSLTPSPDLQPTYPTATAYNTLPSRQQVSENHMKRITSFLLSTSLPISAENQNEFAELTELLAAILKPLQDLRTPVPNPVPVNPKFWAPRWGDKTYAFTRESVTRAFKKHGELAEQLREIAAQELERNDLERKIEEIIEENLRSWSFIEMAFASDKANEVSGSSLCYGTN